MRGDRRLIGLALILSVFAIGLSSHTNAKTRRSLARGASHAKTLVHRDVVLRRGESLDLILTRAGIDSNQRRAAETALLESPDFRPLKVGCHILLTLRRTRARRSRLVALHIDLNRNTDVTVAARDNGKFDPADQQPVAFAPDNGGDHPDLRSVTGVVGPKLDSSLLADGVPINVVREVRQAFIYDPHVPADPPVGSPFDILYDPAARPDAAGTSDALHSVAITIHGHEHSIYRYPVGNGLVAFVAPNGRGVLRARLATPVHDARISSPWGWRINPVLKRPEFHKGIDMAAPMGTPVRAAADGTVAFAGRHGYNGVLIKVKHTAQLVTAYSHLERIAAHLHVGSHVAKGQIIGYVGETGLATGPHLYYEVYVSGERVNPIKTKLAVPIDLAGSNLRRFRRFVVADLPHSLE